MSGQVIVAVLSEAREKFGAFTPERQPEISRWVQARVREIRAGAGVPVTPRPRPAPASWYEREPGEEG